MIRRWRDVATVFGVIALLPCSAVGQGATITGQVVVKGSTISISYAVIGLTPGGHEQFSDGDGRFTLRVGIPGRVTLSARRIGYAPFDTTLDINASDTVRLRLELSLVTIRLPAVYSLAHSCAHPGGTNADLSAELLALFEQVKQNAERNRLLSRSYPFETIMERKITRPEPKLEARFIAFDTVRVPSEREWRYAPGKMLGTREYAPGVFGGKWVTITTPELADFADDRFLENHCFDFGGVDVVDNDSLLRVDFRPGPNVHDPDIAGTMFLDRTTFQLRMTEIMLVNLNKQLKQTITGQAVRAKFKEIIPGVPVLDVVSSLVFPLEVKDGPPLEPSTEDQRTLSVRFLRGKP